MQTHPLMKFLALLLLPLQLCCCSSHARQAPLLHLPLATRILKDSLFIPWEIIYGPDDHIWFTQKNGYICRMDTTGRYTDTLYHEPTTVTQKESGMLGMALHPQFSEQPYVYVVFEYLNPAGNIRGCIERLTYSPTANTLSAPFILLDSINGYLYHNGCRLLIVGDKLFMSIADATDTTMPQNPAIINGKILRLNLDGTIPADNPIPGSPVWSLGHRNVQGLTYANDRLYSSEHGPETDDEVNIITSGANYGWPYVRGYCDKPWETDFCATANVTEPLHAWTPTIAPCGIDYYDNPHFPALQNSLLLTTLKDMHLYRLALSNTYDAITEISIVDGVSFGRLRDICIAPNGHIYLSTSNSDPNNTSAHIDRIIELYDPGQAASNTITLYPNPATQYVYVSLPTAYTTLYYTIIDMSGRIVARGDAPAIRPRLPLTYLAPGTYRAIFHTDRGGKWASFLVRE